MSSWSRFKSSGWMRVILENDSWDAVLLPWLSFTFFHEVLSAASSVLFSSYTSYIDNASCPDCVWPSKHRPCSWFASRHSFDRVTTKWPHKARVPVEKPALLPESWPGPCPRSKPSFWAGDSRLQILASVERFSPFEYCTDTSFCDKLRAEGIPLLMLLSPALTITQRLVYALHELHRPEMAKLDSIWRCEAQ